MPKAVQSRTISPESKIRQRCFVDLSRVSFATYRGVEWATDSYVMVRVDALRTRPKEGRDAHAVPAKAIARVITAARGGTGLSDTHAQIHSERDGLKARVLYGHGRTVLLNPQVAAEWLDHEWDQITQADSSPVLFWRKRRGRLVLVGMVMPMYPGFGELCLVEIGADHNGCAHRSEAVA